MKPRIVTIDGPAGAGKTTVARRLAADLNCVYVDTGALYRGVAYEIVQQKIDWQNDTALERFLAQLDLNFNMDKQTLVLTSQGNDISAMIRTPEISMLASSASAKPQVRAALLDIQKRIGAENDAVFEGRDMGTVVFPDAPYKFFLFADINVRARRRCEEMPESQRDIDRVREQMAIRDTNDATRTAAPLKPAPDAISIDSTTLTVDQVVGQMIQWIKKA